MGFRLLFRCLAMAAGSTPHGPKQTAFFGPGPDRAQTEPLVQDRRQTGLYRSKRYISVAITGPDRTVCRTVRPWGVLAAGTSMNVSSVRYPSAQSTQFETESLFNVSPANEIQ
ncbi:hypothetical protein MIR68_012558 [Amoeboaphelidium protococcarum]|nr:hypothetical protein MIR68_012558 [Amoeboaphelidium protococcarum]